MVVETTGKRERVRERENRRRVVGTRRGLVTGCSSSKTTSLTINKRFKLRTLGETYWVLTSRRLATPDETKSRVSLDERRCFHRGNYWNSRVWLIFTRSLPRDSLLPPSLLPIHSPAEGWLDQFQMRARESWVNFPDKVSPRVTRLLRVSTRFIVVTACGKWCKIGSNFSDTGRNRDPRDRETFRHHRSSTCNTYNLTYNSVG